MWYPSHTIYMAHEQKPTIMGIVVESLPNAMFKVQYQTPEGETKEMLTFLAGKMTYNRIRVLIGDRVTVEIDPYGGKGKIVRRG
jgi:translation initiation factor IF-1